jgi:hypothetical protein
MQQATNRERKTRIRAISKFCPCPECAHKNKKEKRLFNHIWRQARRAESVADCADIDVDNAVAVR